ncbi:ORF [Southern cowpea mosaic virus]|uniref:Movement protein P1 n=1 Tax=Southern cowpea mosaic virus TaxID=196398 RepID=MVP_SCPMV|nr:putative movement protein [Southern cowpea mosaic virus]P21406.1 RecName: Full=Movement protein P1; AltName: Full=Cell-to-cell transport protein [Southern cowpea mosaic virus]AAA46564.1 ORF [Southern cowpea mosaic virus]
MIYETLVLSKTELEQLNVDLPRYSYRFRYSRSIGDTVVEFPGTLSDPCIPVVDVLLGACWAWPQPSRHGGLGLDDIDPFDASFSCCVTSPERYCLSRSVLSGVDAFVVRGSCKLCGLGFLDNFNPFEIRALLGQTTPGLWWQPVKPVYDDRNIHLPYDSELNARIQRFQYTCRECIVRVAFHMSS